MTSQETRISDEHDTSEDKQQNEQMYADEREE